MTAPKKKPNRNPDDPVSRFVDVYGEAVGHARLAAETTDTMGWSELVMAHRSSIRDRRREQANELRALADLLEDRGWSEDDIKAARSCIKATEQVQADDDAFDSMTLDPVRSHAFECQRLVRDAIAEAQRLEGAAPLHQSGLEHLMRAAVDEQPRVEWLVDSARVVVHEAPKA